MSGAPNWLGDVLQMLTLLTSILAIATFVRSGQKVKIEQAESMTRMSSSISVLADSQKRTDDKLDSAIKNADQEHKEIREEIGKVTEKQTTLCALHTVNHPGQL